MAPPGTALETTRGRKLGARLVSRLAIAATVFTVACLAHAAKDGPKRDKRTPPGPRIAMLDVNHIFEHDPRFKQNMEAMKADVEAAEKQVSAKRALLETAKQELQKLTAGTPEHTKLTNDMMKAQGDLTVQIQQQRREFLLREANIYADLYEEVHAACARYAETHNVEMVLRFTSDPVNRGKPESVLSWINRPVVWHEEEVDVTQAIVDAMIAARKGGGGNPAHAEGEVEWNRPD